MGYRELYDKYLSLHHSQRYDLEKLPFEYDRICRFWKQHYIRKYLPQNKQAESLDIGCGMGQHLYALKALGYTNLQGIDISREEIELCTKNIKGVDFMVADAVNFLPQQKEKYDFILMFDVLEHFTKEEALQVSRLVYNSLKSGGICLTRVPNASNPLGMHLRYADLTHETCYTERSLKELLWLAGFSKVEVIGLRSYIADDRLLWRKVAKNLIYRPLAWMLTNFLKLIYLLHQGGFVGTIQPNIVGVATK